MALWQQAPADSQHAQVVQVANGAEHGLILTDEGIVYSWGGRNDRGQLGRSVGKEQEPAPIADAIRNEVIVQIACGLHHSLVLTQEGAVFAWGHNKAGQLGIEGFKSTAKSDDLVRKQPVAVKGFDGKDPHKIAKSISCGPQSSACVTTLGEVYVWGAFSHYLFGEGTRYGPEENCTVPVRIRGVRDGWNSDQHIPDKIAIHKNHFACTISRLHAKDDLADLIKVLKKRASELAQAKRIMKTEAQDAAAQGDTGVLESEELRNLDEDLKQRRLAMDQRIREIEETNGNYKLELQNIARELIVCDQMDTALQEKSTDLEVDRSKNREALVSTHTGYVETQLRDIEHFKSSNMRNKMQLFEKRQWFENESLALTQEQASVAQERQQIEARAKLIRALQTGCLNGAADDSADDGLRIATSKRQQLAATNPQTLAGVGRFSGFREVLSISDRALHDISSALKEVSSSATWGDGVLEQVLEANLKLRKECNAQILEKLHLAERGGIPSHQRPQDCKEKFQGMEQFFQEVSRQGKNNPKVEAKSKQTGLLGLGGFFGQSSS